MTKIAVYTIALNEEKHVKRWYESAKDADLLLIADTGSTDKTRFIAKSLGIQVFKIEVKPWRFDVARNAALALIPSEIDFCISLDMDERLISGWREAFEEEVSKGINFPTMRLVTGRNSKGDIMSYFDAPRAHPKTGVYWRYPIHEVIHIDPNLVVRHGSTPIYFEHEPDRIKSRSSYLPQLEGACLEFPDDWRMHHYLTREYHYERNWLNLLKVAERSIEFRSGWDIERASTCMWASEAAWELGLQKSAKDWAHRATREAPHLYEAWHWRAHISHLRAEWQDCYTSAKKIDTLTRGSHHLVKPSVWSWWGYDLVALSAHNLGNNVEAIKYGELAIAGNENDPRLKKNLEFYKEALQNA